MTTQTATAPATTDAAIDANARAQRVFLAVADGYDTQRVLIEKTATPKTTLLGTLAYLVEQGRIEKVQDGRNVFYRPLTAGEAYYAGDRAARITAAAAPKERTPSGFDRITETPVPAVREAILRNAAAKTAAAVAAGLTTAPAQRTGSAPERPAAAIGIRLSKGAQEGMILDYLAAHPTASFGPYELGRALAPAGHKALGLRDACARLAERGMITITQDKPVRYAANTAPQQ